MPTVTELLNDLSDENASLDAVVAGLEPAGWYTPTPAEGWDVRDSVSHLCFFDQAAVLALTDAEAFEDHKSRLIADMAAAPDVALGRAITDPNDLLAKWRQTRREYIDAARLSEPQKRVPWYGPTMSLASFTTARILEAWAHGADIRDAVGIPIEATPRVRHVCHIGVSARAFSFAAHGVPDPGDPIRVEAEAPDGSTWTWGPDDAANRVTGTALDLALVLAQRRHRSRTTIEAKGAVAEQWLEIAQAFAGPPTITATDR